MVIKYRAFSSSLPHYIKSFFFWQNATCFELFYVLHAAGFWWFWEILTKIDRNSPQNHLARLLPHELEHRNNFSSFSAWLYTQKFEKRIYLKATLKAPMTYLITSLAMTFNVIWYLITYILIYLNSFTSTCKLQREMCS